MRGKLRLEVVSHDELLAPAIAGVAALGEHALLYELVHARVNGRFSRRRAEIQI